MRSAGGKKMDSIYTTYSITVVTEKQAKAAGFKEARTRRIIQEPE
jgi:hypothetical protein